MLQGFVLAARGNHSYLSSPPIDNLSLFFSLSLRWVSVYLPKREYTQTWLDLGQILFANPEKLWLQFV